MRTKLWNKDYILLLQGSAVSIIGDLMYSVAIGYWVYAQTGSSSLMGLMSSISMFVTMFLSPFSGSIIDKCNRKWVMAGLDAMQGILMITVGIFAHMNALTVPGVLVVALLASLGSVFYNPAVSTLLIDIIPHDHMVQGQSVFSGVNGLINMAGSALSGAMVAFFGVPLIVILNGLSNLYSALSILFIDVPKTVQQGQEVTVAGILRDSGTAVKTIFSDPFLKLFIPCVLILNLLGAGPTTLALPFCMEKGFTVDMYGLMMSVYTAAYLICVVFLGIVTLTPKARYRVLSLCFTASVPLFAMAYLSDDFVTVCVFLFLAAFANAAGNAVFNSCLMLALPEENRGAILGFLQSASTGGSALSAVIYGILGDIFPLYLVFVAGTLLSLPPMLYMCFHPKTKGFVLTH